MKLALCAAAAALALGSSLSAQVPTVLLREGDVMASVDVAGSFLHVDTNGTGYACNVRNDTSSISHIWGSFSGGAGAVLRSQGVIGGYAQFSLGTRFGMGGTALGYESAVVQSVPFASLPYTVWVDDTLIAKHGDAIPTLPTKAYGDSSKLHPRMTRQDVVHWIAGLKDIASGVLEGEALFRGNGQVLLKPGDHPAGLPAPVRTLDEQSHAVSALGVTGSSRRTSIPAPARRTSWSWTARRSRRRRARSSATCNRSLTRATACRARCGGTSARSA